MIQLTPKKLSTKNIRLLNQLQKQIDSEAVFADKVARAQLLWRSKGGKPGQEVFSEIYDELYDLCVYVGICNYCEQSEANDIEHIYPKSFFPNLTFNWDNYLLACKQCNTAYKLDQCFVLDKKNNVLEVKRGNEPKHNIGCFINPKTEDPNNFIILNLLSFKFDLIPGINKKDTNKALTTLKILELNQRDTLIEARKSASRHFYEMLDRLRRILETASIEELEESLNPYDDRFDLTQPLGSIKASIVSSYKAYISSYQHPSVWHSIKAIESKTNAKWINLFKQIPVALTW